MSVSKTLKEALMEQSWDKVVKAYNSLTGKKNGFALLGKMENVISTPKEVENVPEKDHEATENDDVEPTEVEIEDVESLPEEDIIDIEEGEDEGGSIRCRRMPFKIGKRKNNFLRIVNDAVDAIKDVKFDKAVRSDSALENRRITKRPKAKKIRVKCDRCERVTILEDPALAPRKMPGDNQRSRFICDSCVGQARKGR